MFIGHFDSALRTFFHYLQGEKQQNKNAKCLTINPYNAILKGLAFQVCNGEMRFATVIFGTVKNIS